MKPLFVGVQVAVFLSVLLFSYFLGAPLYLQIVKRLDAYDPHLHSGTPKPNCSPPHKEGFS
mgnify:FL=1